MPEQSARAQKCDVWRVCERVGIKLKTSDEHRAVRKPKECFCRRTLKAIGRRHGEAHLELTLRLIVESKGNAAALQGDTISAVSRVVLSDQVVVDGALFDRFDSVDLGELRAWASAARPGCSTSDTMAAVLLWQLAGVAQ